MSKTASYFSTVASKYDFRYRFKWAKWQLRTIFGQFRGFKGTSILDAGTGTGVVALSLARMFPSCRVVGTDISAGMLAVAERKRRRLAIANVEFMRMDSECIAFKGRKFDAVVSNSSFHHVKDKLGAFRRIGRALEDGGKLVISDWFLSGGRDEFSGKEVRSYKRSFSRFMRHPTVPAHSSKHPPEYNITTEEFGRLLRRAGFGRIRVIKSPHLCYAVVTAVKQT